MREIKFRAWDKKQEVMLEINRILFFPRTKKGDWCQILPIFWKEWLLVPSEATLMQFTGLLDKNGKDLDWWESDMLRKGSNHPNAPIGIITYSERDAMWVIAGKSGGEFCELSQAYENGWLKIGDIHSSPGLLEKK